MEIKIVNCRISVTFQGNLQDFVAKKYKINPADIEEFRILRQSVDARKKNDIVYDYQFYLKLTSSSKGLLNYKEVSEYKKPISIVYHEWKGKYAPVVVGFGPSGMFAALYLARCGAKPIVIERGSPIEKRQEEVDNFLKNKVLNKNSNIQFGEGGAGAFSDGKLTTNVNSPLNAFILNEFYLHGADQDVTYSATPHVGTDYLAKVVKNIREEIIQLGGKFYFNTLFTDFEAQQNELLIHCSQDILLKTNHLLLCLGHSARDTITHLYSKGMPMEAKAFSMGVRVEHLQTDVNKMQYGSFAKYLPNASYKAVVHLKDRSVYTFCMCPGGEVMASASEPDTIVTNGMSRKKRDKANANAALLVNVTPADFYHNSPLDGLAYQQKYEKAAFDVAGDYRAPCNLFKEFLHGTVATQVRSVKPSYPHGVLLCDLKRCLPTYVVEALWEAIPKIDAKMRGFYQPDALMIGIESRSSSPVRILRGDNMQSVINGVYPVGEGAGYAGGIMSAAIDGLRVAMKIVEE